ncbi:MAG: hypothetical protein GTN71_21225 [Anaerolineae bacterium]|nr:hypothetical protein [Anaerolineae bacterium]
MTTHKLTFLILVLILVPLLSACGTDGMDTPSRPLATPSAESRLEVSEATPIPTEPPVPTDTSVPPTPVPTEPPVPTDTSIPPTPVATELPLLTDTPVPPTPVVALPPPTLLYFWAQW